MPGELDRAEEFGADILRLCVEVGGVLTGEHGVGVEKRDLMPEMFNEIDLDQQMRVKCAFDPNHLLNPGKVFPQLHRCAELGRMHVHGGQAAVPGHSEVLRERMTAFFDTPLWPAGHLPHKGGDQNAARLAPIVDVASLAGRSKLIISPLVGEMAGRPEGGAKGLSFPAMRGRGNSPVA